MKQLSLEDSHDSIHFQTAWEHVQEQLKAETQQAWYDRFLRPLKPVTLVNDVARIAVPGRFVLEWVRERYANQLATMLSDELGRPIQLELISEGREKPTTHAVASVAVTPVSEPVKFKPVDKFTFERFVVGQSNRLAFAGAKAVAAEPGTKFNPLFIYGQSGLGKTHLLHAIARECLNQDPKFPLVYVSAQQFAEDFVAALQNGKLEAFRRAQRNVKLWLVDDIQFIAGKDKTQEELFQTFNHLQQLGNQIVLCSDRPPRDLYLMDERLRSRFEAGLVADIQMPDTETRCAILLSKAQMERIPLDHDVAMFLAENVPGNIRILEGALTRMTVLASVEGIPVTHELASNMVEMHYRSGVMAKPSFNQIVDTVGKHYKIGTEEIKGTSRKAPIVHARHIAVYITREITGDSWKHIGGLFGDRDHTSMMHGYQKISEMMHQDKDLRATVKQLIRNLYPES